MRALSLVLAAILFPLCFVACVDSNGELFPVDAYLSSPANLQGNRYILDGEIDSQLNGVENVGRIIAVRPLNHEVRLPLYVADELKANLMVAQRYRFEITVRKGALLTVTAMKKL